MSRILRYLNGFRGMAILSTVFCMYCYVDKGVFFPAWLWKCIFLIVSVLYKPGHQSKAAENTFSEPRGKKLKIMNKFPFIQLNAKQIIEIAIAQKPSKIPQNPRNFCGEGVFSSTFPKKGLSWPCRIRGTGMNNCFKCHKFFFRFKRKFILCFFEF